MSQVKTIAGILEREGQIDNFRSIREKISVRLAARIADLRALGWEIETRELDDKNTVYVLKARPVRAPVKPKLVPKYITQSDGQLVVRMVPERTSPEASA